MPRISLFTKLLALVSIASKKFYKNIYFFVCLFLVMITAILSTILPCYLAGQIRGIIKQFIFLYKDVQFLKHGCNL